jgi:hypothetical protein
MDNLPPRDSLTPGWRRDADIATALLVLLDTSVGGDKDHGLAILGGMIEATLEEAGGEIANEFISKLLNALTSRGPRTRGVPK